MSETDTLAAPRRVQPRRRPVEQQEPIGAPRIPVGVLAESVEQALCDLSRSVSAEALPEMAMRLARHRLRASYSAPPPGEADPAAGRQGNPPHRGR
ncbi:MAG: hypothetical protein ACJ74U_09915 [Jatrophihabitantaceae bacterium]